MRVSDSIPSRVGWPLLIFAGPDSFMSEKNTILVVEDNDFVRTQISGFLKAAGHDVVEAREGAAALSMMTDAGRGIGLAIVDVRMEPVDGFEFIRDLRRYEIRTPVILATGDQTTDLLEQARKFEVSAVLMKPVEKDRLLNTVERVLKQAGKRH